mmetsp:Transcript_27256/g.26304  ORF Transcript_27256/g.26304 Transcript_27256/m.26304 type:complete len:108 (+) Transcript_27256:40-363(+)
MENEDLFCFNDKPQAQYKGEEEHYSDTSSYGDEEDQDRMDKSMELNFEDKKEKAEKEIKEMVGDFEELEEGTTSSYAKFKTANEVDPELIEKFAPKCPQLDDMDNII